MAFNVNWAGEESHTMSRDLEGMGVFWEVFQVQSPPKMHKRHPSSMENILKFKKNKIFNGY